MTKTTLNKMTITEDEIDNYVDTLTNTITSVTAEKVSAKPIKGNSIGLPIRKRDSWKMYCDGMELSESQDAAW